jgi:hypothetical protein
MTEAPKQFIPSPDDAAHAAITAPDGGQDAVVLSFPGGGHVPEAEPAEVVTPRVFTAEELVKRTAILTHHLALSDAQRSILRARRINASRTKRSDT